MFGNQLLPPTHGVGLLVQLQMSAADVPLLESAAAPITYMITRRRPELPP